MSNFTPLVNQEFEFQGDVIKTSYSRLKRQHMLGVMPAMKSLQEAVTDGDEDKQQEAINEILDKLIDVIPEYMKSFSGLKDSDGNEINIETVVNEFYFLSLAAQIATQIVKDSSATEGNA